MKFTFLGTGTSYGMPMLGCDCPRCHSEDPHDRRLRSAGWLHDEAGDLSILIDVGPDFRQQALREGIKKLTAVFLTHFHADHLFGVDDLRAFSNRGHCVVPLYAQRESLDFLQEHFDYIFTDQNFKLGWGIPRIQLCEIGEKSPVELPQMTVCMIPMMHGRQRIAGYRFGRFAYLTDCSRMPEESYALLEGVDTIVLDGLRWRPHPTHFSIDEAIVTGQRIGARRVYLTDVCHDVSHQVAMARMPVGFFMAYDGLTIDVEI